MYGRYGNLALSSLLKMYVIHDIAEKMRDSGNEVDCRHVKFAPIY